MEDLFKKIKENLDDIKITKEFDFNEESPIRYDKYCELIDKK